MLRITQPVRHPRGWRSTPRLRHGVAGRAQPDAPRLAAARPAEKELKHVRPQDAALAPVGNVDGDHGGSAALERLGERGTAGEDLEEDAGLPVPRAAKRATTQLEKSELTC